MKIYGIGTDITNIKRIRKSINNKKFIERIFDKSEIKKCNNVKKKLIVTQKDLPQKRLFLKAIGTGMSKGINFKK